MTLHTGRFFALAVAALVFIFVSCEGEEPSGALAGNGRGKVMLSICKDVAIEVKSQPAPQSEVDDYKFRFVGVGDNGTSDYYRYGDVSWPMDWYFGIFRLQAESCSFSEAESGYGKLRYEGIGQPFSVINNQTASTSVVCKIANIRVNVDFNDKMFLSYKDFKLVVESVLAPVYEEDEDGNESLVQDARIMRTLDFTTINKVGFYNHHQRDMWIHYTLYVMVDGATEFMEMANGYFGENESGQPASVNAGDYITLNVNYVGDVQSSSGIKFIVDGDRQSMSNSVGIEDYEQGSVDEDE